MQVFISGVLIGLGLLGMLVAYLRPTWNKRLFGKFASRRLLTIFFGLLLIAGVALVWSHQHHSQQKKAAAEASFSKAIGPVVWKDLPARLDKSPHSGPVQYKIAADLPAGKPLSGRITIVTPEKTVDRVIKLNDKLLDTFNANKQIVNGAQVFYLDYFDDQASAKDYFSKQSDKNVSNQEKQALINHYVATMVYHSGLNLKFLIYIPTGQIVKRY